MTGARAVQIARPRSTISGPFVEACKPLIHCSVKLWAEAASRLIDCSRLYAVTGIMTLISKLPDCPAIVIVVWLPITCAQTIQTDSAITGLTLPGMIELPGCTAGRSISPIPARGPEPSQRILLAIFIRLTAIVLSDPF